jgi:hypothetical protein
MGSRTRENGPFLPNKNIKTLTEKNNYKNPPWFLYPISTALHKPSLVCVPKIFLHCKNTRFMCPKICYVKVDCNIPKIFTFPTCDYCSPIRKTPRHLWIPFSSRLSLQATCGYSSPVDQASRIVPKSLCLFSLVGRASRIVPKLRICY